MAVIPNQQTPKPVVNPYVKAFDPNTPATPQASTVTPVPSMNASASGQTPQMATASNSAPVPAMPALGYGGANYATADTATRQSITDNENKLNSDPNFVKSEYARTQDVIKNRQASNLDVTDQQSYLSGLQKRIPDAISIKKVDETLPQTATPYGQLTPAQIASEAKARIDKQRAALAGAVDYAKTGLKNNFDYTNKIQGDRRQLENTTFQRDNSPFNGRSDYLAENMLRDRSIADTASNNQYNAAVQSEDAKLSSFDQLAPEQQAAMGDELTRLERQYGLDVGSLTGQFGGSPTLAAQGQAAQYTGVYGGQPTIQAQGQQFNQNMATQQFQYGQQQDTVKNQQWQQNFDEDSRRFGIDNALKTRQLDTQVQQFAASQNLDWAKLSQSQKQFVAQQAMQSEQFTQDMAYKNKSLDAQNNPNSLDNKYKQSQIDSLTNKTDKATTKPIDQYDLLVVEDSAKKAGIDPAKSNPTQIKSFVAGMKAQHGWTTEEAQQVESYLNGKIAPVAPAQPDTPRPFGYRFIGG